MDIEINNNYSTSNPNYERSKKIVYIKAIFTNDESKLIDLIEPDLQVLTMNENLGVFNYTANSLPDKKVEGTHIWKYVTLDDKDLHITEILLGVGEDGFAYNVISLPVNDSIYSYAYFDYEYNESFQNRVEWVTILVDKIA